MITSDLVAFLAGRGLGTAGTDLFAEKLPDSPAAAAGLITYGGSEPGMVQNHSGVNTEPYSIQVQARAATTPAAQAKAKAIMDAVLELANASLNGHRILTVWPMQMPFKLRIDEAGLPVWAFNFHIVRDP